MFVKTIKIKKKKKTQGITYTEQASPIAKTLH